MEERAFKRISKRLLARDCPILKPATSLPSPPPDTPEDIHDTNTEYEARRKALTKERYQWREDVMLDFAAFEASIARIQFLCNSNEQERERYASDKSKILSTAQAIKENTAELRLHLDKARKSLAMRKVYDELAERITENRMLKPREEQNAQLEKLEAEITGLEQESRDYANTWAERRGQFGRIVEEGRQMLRIIRDEKEEAERKEGMEGRSDVDDGDGTTSKGASHSATPLPEQGGATPMQAGLGSEITTESRISTLKNRPISTSSPAVGNSGLPSPTQQKGEDFYRDTVQDIEMKEVVANRNEEETVTVDVLAKKAEYSSPAPPDKMEIA